MKHKVIIFNSDEEFENFAINPYAQIDSDNNPYGDYSNAYRQCIEQGIEFIIMGGDSNSSINRRDVVSKRVLLPQEFRIAGRNDVLIQLSVENLIKRPLPRQLCIEYIVDDGNIIEKK